MFTEKVNQLIESLETQELHVSVKHDLVSNEEVFVNAFWSLPQATSGILSTALYAELFAAYLFKDDLYVLRLGNGSIQILTHHIVITSPAPTPASYGNAFRQPLKTMPPNRQSSNCSTSGPCSRRSG